MARRSVISSSVSLTLSWRAGDVEGDLVAFLQQCNGAANRGLGSHVAHHGAVAGAGEAAVGYQGNIVAEALADYGGGYPSISCMPGPPLGPS